MAYLFDAAIIVILAFFAWRGAKRGLVLMLCSLLGIFVAFFGARFLSAAFYEPVANIVEPVIYQSITDIRSDDNQTAAHDASSQKQDTYALEKLLTSMKESELFTGFSEFLDNAVSDNQVEQVEGGSAAKAVSRYLSLLVARVILFAAAFLLILLIWFLLGRALDLTFHLPVLSTLNRVGGLAFGLAKAVLLVVVLVWLCQLAGWISSPPTTPVTSLFTARNILNLLSGLTA